MPRMSRWPRSSSRCSVEGAEEVEDSFSLRRLAFLESLPGTTTMASSSFPAMKEEEAEEPSVAMSATLSPIPRSSESRLPRRRRRRRRRRRVGSSLASFRPPFSKGESPSSSFGGGDDGTALALPFRFRRPGIGGRRGDDDDDSGDDDDDDVCVEKKPRDDEIDETRTEEERRTRRGARMFRERIVVAVARSGRFIVLIFIYIL
mmetsp:Transcript_12264/g.25365  ORF Transcript_12264/g.25365 Transcript_12264/m.25365 type:complete len:204 (-) Transcript_12264:6-617(-)